MTDTKEAGIGQDAGGQGSSDSSSSGYGTPISVYPETGSAEKWWSDSHKNVCEVVPDVDEGLVNAQIPGPYDDPVPAGTWGITNNCQTWAQEVLDNARRK